jgi:peptide/nickel transport system ATP-binding protein
VVFRRRIGEVRAVNGVSFDLLAGRTLGIVGESGSGKSTLLQQILELTAPQAGSIEVLGEDVTTLTASRRRQLRREIQVVFQDPVSSLDPRLPVFDLLAEPLQANGFARKQIESRVAELLEIVGLRNADAARYPAEFSGGQKQRIGIARALALQPKILALDEPVSALDVSIQAGIINLLLDLQQQFHLSYLFISHDLAVVRHLAHDVAVMYRGEIVESGPSDRLFSTPTHAYTQKLLAAIPKPVIEHQALSERPVPDQPVPEPNPRTDTSRG